MNKSKGYPSLQYCVEMESIVDVQQSEVVAVAVIVAEFASPFFFFFFFEKKEWRWRFAESKKP